MKQSFTVKDLINAGLFTLLIFASTFIGGMFGLFPFLMPLIPFICGVISGPIFMLYSTKIHRFGMLLIMALVMGLYFTVSGHGIYMLPGVVVLALIGEYILKQGNYKSVNHARWAYVVYCISSIFNFMPIYFTRAAYTEKLIQDGYGKEYAEKMMSVLPDWSLIPLVILGGVGAYIGCTIGIKMLNKHFKKLGML